MAASISIFTEDGQTTFDIQQDVASYIEGLIYKLNTAELERGQCEGQLVETRNYWSELYAQKNDELESLRAQLKVVHEQCAAICDEEASEWDSDDLICDKNYAAAAAQRIKALSAPVPAQPSPEPEGIIESVAAFVES